MRRTTGTGERRPRAGVDLEEVRPHIFWIHDPRVKPVLKGEGIINGQQFELTSWRREGLLARLRERGFNVRTLADQVEALPNPPRGVKVGGEVVRPLATAIERWSYFDPLALTWVPVEAHEQEGQRVVTLREGWATRRRKGRGAAEYYIIFGERSGGAGLRPIEEDRALLTGYALATGLRERDLAARRVEKSYVLLPDLPLPGPYRTLMGRIGERTPEGWRVHERGLPLAQELFSRLGLLLHPVEAPAGPTAPTSTPSRPRSRQRR